MIIDTNKIRKFAAITVITANVVAGTLVTSFAINANCASTNHVRDDCFRSKFLNVIDIDDTDNVSKGVQHRLDEIRKRNDVVDVYYGDILENKYDYILAKEDRNGIEVTYTAPYGYTLVGKLCKSIKPVGQVKIGTGIVVTYTNGTIGKTVLNSNDSLLIGKTFEEYPTSSLDQKIITTATYEETLRYEKAKLDFYDEQYVDYAGGKYVDKDDEKLIEYRSLTLKNKN